MGDAGETNVQGEAQKKLDVYANERFKAALEARGEVCGIAWKRKTISLSSTMNWPRDGSYVVRWIPDGIKYRRNVSVGTIFSIYRRQPSGHPPPWKTRKPGCNQVAAGYVVYGRPPCWFHTTGNGVHGFTYDPALGYSCLFHENMRTPKTGWHLLNQRR